MDWDLERLNEWRTSSHVILIVAKVATGHVTSFKVVMKEAL